MRRLTDEERARLHRFFWPPHDDDVEAMRAALSELRTSEELHQLAWSYSWDDLGPEAPAFIVRHPECDLGTAVLLYWHSGPRYFAQYAAEDEVPEHSRIVWALHREIEEKVASGHYLRRELRFDPRDDEGHDWTLDYAELPQRRVLPAFMEAATPGAPCVREEVASGDRTAQ